MLTSIPSTQDDNLFVYYCDHGEIGYLCVPDGNGMPILADDLNNVLNTMYKLRKYKNLLFFIEACHSGSIGKRITAPHSITMVAAKEEETSKSGDHDDTISLPINDLFTKHLLISLKENPHYTINETFNAVKKAVTKHTVELYCNEDMKNMLVSDFIGIPSKQKPNLLESRRPNVANINYIKSEQEMINSSNKKKFLSFMEKIVKQISTDSITQLLTEIQDKTNDSCYFDSIRLLYKKVPQINREDFNKFSKVFYNLCAKYPKSKIIDAIVILLQTN